MLWRKNLFPFDFFRLLLLPSLLVFFLSMLRGNTIMTRIDLNVCTIYKTGWFETNPEWRITLSRCCVTRGSVDTNSVSDLFRHNLPASKRQQFFKSFSSVTSHTTYRSILIMNYFNFVNVQRASVFTIRHISIASIVSWGSRNRLNLTNIFVLFHCPRKPNVFFIR